MYPFHFRITELLYGSKDMVMEYEVTHNSLEDMADVLHQGQIPFPMLGNLLPSKKLGYRMSPIQLSSM